MAQTFSAQVEAWVTKSKKRLEAVVRTAAQDVTAEILQRTPVDTGFLRASFTVTLDGPLPIRADYSGVAGASYQPQPYALVIAGSQLGQTIYGTFTASYAAHVEYGARGRAGAGMVRLSAQNWQQHVARAVAQAKARFR